METKPIIVRVNVEAAHIFESAPEEQKRKIEAILSLKLTEATRDQHQPESTGTGINTRNFGLNFE